jgi:hypothetical protein
MEKITGLIPEEAFVTETYIIIKEKVYEFLEDKIDEASFKKFIYDIKKIVQTSRQDYEESYISSREWTLEVVAGDRLLREGFYGYEKGLDFLEACCMSKEKEELDRGIDMIYNGNKKLITNQYLAEYVNKQVVKYRSLKYAHR